jgi:hypothetical protein
MEKKRRDEQGNPDRHRALVLHMRC